LRDVNTICRRSWYIAAHIWKIYDFKIEVLSCVLLRRSIELLDTLCSPDSIFNSAYNYSLALYEVGALEIRSSVRSGAAEAPQSVKDRTLVGGKDPLPPTENDF
jgi:hypothetical protein